jgi:manganese efflux pump family protein
MHIVELLLVAIGLSFDTFAVSVSTGLTINHIRFWQGVRIALVLAVFQALMPFIGWLGGIQIVKYLSNYDHWIAFGLLTALGIKMITESFKPAEEKKFNPLLLSVLVIMAVATSIDALVVGVSFAFVDTKIVPAMAVIGAITFLVAMIGMLLGKNVNSRFGKRAEIIGGLILIGIGLKILLSHLM